jgi:hypothetical protein
MTRSSVRRILCVMTTPVAALVVTFGAATWAAAATPLTASPPTVTSVSPNDGYSLALNPVTITGTNFTGATAVDFGSTPGTNLVVESSTTMTVTTPGLAEGPVNVTVTTPAGTSAVSSGSTYMYVGPVPTEGNGFPGYWLVGSDGGVFSFGYASFFGSTGSLKLQRPVVGIAPAEGSYPPQGYWLVASDGGIFSFGSAPFEGSLPGLGLHPAGSGLPHSLNAPIVGMVLSHSGDGYFLVGADGGVFAFGNALFEGSCPGIGGCVGTAVAVVTDPSGEGYWVMTNSGQVYGFGDAGYYGAPGNQGSPVTAAVSTSDGRGYMILLADGSVLLYGDAVNFGGPSVGTFGGSNPATALFTNEQALGYGVVSANGTVDTYGYVADSGGMAGTKLNGSIIAAAGF